MAHYISEACIGCGLCKKNCPVQAISGAFKQRHVIDDKACIDCGSCGRVCGKSAVLDDKGAVCVKPRDELLRLPLIDEVKCTACRLCVENCVKRVLKISEPKFPGDIRLYSYISNEKLCIGCGMCERVCPRRAVVMVEKRSIVGPDEAIPVTK